MKWVGDNFKLAKITNAESLDASESKRTVVQRAHVGSGLSSADTREHALESEGNDQFMSIAQDPSAEKRSTGTSAYLELLNSDSGESAANQ